MYKVSVPYTDYKKKPHTADVYFNLDAREVFKMLPELKAVFEWFESNKNEEEKRQLSVEEVTKFYTDFEALLLEAYGEISEDGEYFRKGGRYEFEESALFNACMVQFVFHPEDTGKLLEGILPPELMDMVKNATPEQLDAATKAKLETQDEELARLRAQVAAQQGTAQ